MPASKQSPPTSPRPRTTSVTRATGTTPTGGARAKNVRRVDAGRGESVNLQLMGSRLRARRLAKGISLRQFARDLDVSASFISQLETGKAQPSVATLYAICTALGISSDELFESEATASRRGQARALDIADVLGAAPIAEPGAELVSFGDNDSPVVRADQRKTLVLDSGVTWESLTSYRRARTDFVYVRYDVGGSSSVDDRLIRHVGTEYGLVLRGSLEITLGFETYVLGPGDAFCFDSMRPHRFANVGDVPVEAVWFNLERLDS